MDWHPDIDKIISGMATGLVMKVSKEIYVFLSKNFILSRPKTMVCSNSKKIYFPVGLTN